MFCLADIFKKKIEKEDIATLLRTSPDRLLQFEKAYRNLALRDSSTDNFFQLNAKQAAEMQEGITNEDTTVDLNDMINRIVKELISAASVWSYDGKHVFTKRGANFDAAKKVTNEEIIQLPEQLRPALTGSLAKIDIKEPSYMVLANDYQKYLMEKNFTKKNMFYHHFRQGLDILDLDPITYEMIATNPNSMGHWLPQLVHAASQRGFFKIPKTTILRVPLPMLQLTRLDYMSLTRTTLDIVDMFCREIFNLEEDKEYFIKTGTYSSKFDFRNAYVHGTKEVRELGEYLLFIHHQACQMASPLNNISIYGVSTTNEWVVREFIRDKENNPCIYKGLPLHTEYRAFVDLDSKEVLGINPYWDSKIMKQRFGHEEDKDSPHNMHDFIIYSMHEETLMNRYHENESKILKQVELLVNDMEGLSGQWSIDIMQNGKEFWLIDMALAANSALKECIPRGKLKPVQENWIPVLK